MPSSPTHQSADRTLHPAACYGALARPGGCAAAPGSGTLGAKKWKLSLSSDVLAWLGVEELLTLERAEVVRLAAVLTLARRLVRIDTLAADRVLGHQTAPFRHWQGKPPS